MKNLWLIIILVIYSCLVILCAYGFGRAVEARKQKKKMPEVITWTRYVNIRDIALKKAADRIYKSINRSANEGDFSCMISEIPIEIQDKLKKDGYKIKQIFSDINLFDVIWFDKKVNKK
jgi:hypothetical protein